MSVALPGAQGVVERLHGVEVCDPYRWLENRHLPETEAWIQAQQKRSEAYFASLPAMTTIRDEVCRRLDIETVDQPARAGNRYFFRRRQKDQEQGCIYCRDRHSENEQLLADPAPSGAFHSVSIYRISLDGSLLAYERREGGEGLRSIHFVDVSSRETITDHLQRGFTRGLAFSPDKTGFYYCHETSSESPAHTMRFHLFGSQHEDEIVLSAPRSRGSRLVLISDAVHLGAIWIREVDGILVGALWVSKRGFATQWHLVLARQPLPFRPILHRGRIYMFGQHPSTGKRVTEFDIAGSEKRTLALEGEGTALLDITFAGDRIYVLSLGETGYVLTSRSIEPEHHQPTELAIPAHGTMTLLPSLGDDSSLFLSHESLANPATVYEIEEESGTLRHWPPSALATAAGSYRTDKVFVLASDGERIPISLTYSPNTKFPAPAIMTGYGSFGVAVTQTFSVLVTLLLDLGAVFAVAHIRGGGECGLAWHEAGRAAKKPRAFDDFLEAAEWLCSKGFTRPDQLGIFGGSNAGLLAAVAMTKRPSLFRAVLCIAPLLDMVRYESLDDATKWRHEYGTVDDADDFAVLRSYSPYHQVENNTDYAATLLISGDKDSRCNPAHARKMTALLQERPGQNHAILLEYSPERGHSPNLPLSVRVTSLARRIGFLCRELNIPVEGDRHDIAGS